MLPEYEWISRATFIGTCTVTGVCGGGVLMRSFLGMDPAYLVWIPPFAPGCWDRDDSGDQLLGLADVVSEHELHEFPSQREYYTTTLEGSNTQLTEFITPKVIIQSLTISKSF